ncbi:unnamed protein product [Orchesella dallaii]|uniref:Uncharacterized protein n=1 Tax=Orchesella dallaii TaxID=48710 RepID=A0ABP1Q7C0_9HEXA
MVSYKDFIVAANKQSGRASASEPGIGNAGTTGQEGQSSQRPGRIFLHRVYLAMQDCTCEVAGCNNQAIQHEIPCSAARQTGQTSGTQQYRPHN